MQRAQQRGANFQRATLIQFEPDGGAFPAVVQFVFDRFEQVVGIFFVEVQLAVARDPEMPVTENVRSGKQIGEVMADELAEKDVILARIIARQFHQLRQHPRHLHDGEMAQCLALLRHFQLHHHVQRFVEQLREGMRRIDRQRRQQREDVVEEMVLDPVPLGLADIAAVDQHDAHLGQDAAQIAPDRLLVDGELRDGLVDEDELLGGCQAVRTALGNALPHLGLDTGDADHEEFIKVIGGNRQKSHPLERGVAGIDRLLQHPAVEMQPGKLAIDEAFGTGARCWAGRSIRNFLFYYNGLRGFHEVSVHPMAASCAIIAHAAKHVLLR